jgi:gliding motility-associated-like protein
MKRILILILFFTSALAFSQSKNVLFIGNSYTDFFNLPQIVTDVANSNGDNMTFESSAVASYSLNQHSTYSNTLNLINNGGWDYVVLQEFSQYPSEPLSWVEQNVYPYAQYLDNLINNSSPNAETIFYMTWGRRDGDADRCSRLPEVCTYIGMDNLTRERYMYMAEANHAIVSPVGAVWRYIRENYPSINLYDPDGSHPSEAGSYAAACCFYTTIFRKDPTQITYNFTLNSSDANIIKAAAKSVVFDNLLTWHIGEYELDTQAPSAPTDLVASNISETSFTLTWTSSSDNTGVTEYEVYQDGTLLKSVISNSANINGLISSTTYPMTVKAKDAAGNTSVSSSILNVTTNSYTPYNLTVVGITASDKVYDGTINTALNTGSALLVGIISGDVVNLVTTGASGVFESKNVGTNKIVSITGLTLSGSDASKYVLSQPTTSANITRVELLISGITADNKVYDGTTLTSLNTASGDLIGIIESDNVTLGSTNAVGTFADKYVGPAKSVSTSGFSLFGSDAGNYYLSQPLTSADITKAELTITGLNANKAYDRTTNAILNSTNASLTGVVPGDNVTLNSTSATGFFTDYAAGTNKLVSTSGFALEGIDSENYTLSQPTLLANIARVGLAVSGLTAYDKVYDGTTTVILNTGSAAISGVIQPDVIILNSASAAGTFNNKNAGNGKIISTSGFTIGGPDSGNYTLFQPTLTANISKAGLTISGITANNKIYDGTTLTSLNAGSASLIGIIQSDIVTLGSINAVGVFADKNTGTGIRVTTSGFTLGGTNSENYTLTPPTIMADITIASLNISGIKAENKIYDGTTSAFLNTGGGILSGLVSGDAVTLVSTSASGVFENKNVGTAKAILISGFAITGKDSYNYILNQPLLNADILPKVLTITANNLSKHFRTILNFNGTEFTAEGLIPGDIIPVVTISSPGAIESAAIGQYVISIYGAHDNNYNINYVNGILTVNKSILIAKAENKTKIYGSENPELSISYTGFINNEDASFIDIPPAASTDALKASNTGFYNIILSQGSDDNYTITLQNGILEVVKAPLTVTANDQSRIYKEVNPDLTITYSGFVLGQDQSILEKLPVIGTVANLESEAGNYEINVSGASAKNYNFFYKKGILTINKANQMITFSQVPAGLRMTQSYDLEATATSGLDVRFEVSDSNIGSLYGNTLKIWKEGNLVITAKQEGNKNWNQAPFVSQNIETLPTFDNISSLFTPNNDGMNDYWYIPDLDQFGKLQVTVYNRFGQIVYQSDGYKNDWDGTWNSYPLPSASYYYIIKSAKKGFIKGVVNIVR